MSQTMGTYTQMRTFVTVIDENSFNQASKKLHISAAEISRRISSLEASLNATLIHRTTRKLTLTPLGEVYYHDCKRILQDIESSRNKILSQQQEPAGDLTIYYGSSEALLPRINEFHKRYPKVMLHLKKIERIADFKSKEADIILGLSNTIGLDEDSVLKKIDSVRYALCASSQYLEQHNPIKKPRDLNNHRYIAHGSRPNPRLIYFKDDQQIHMDSFMFLYDTEEMIKAACLDLGLIWVHENRVREHLQNKHLVEVLKSYERAPTNLYMVYAYSRYLEPPIKAFVDFYDDKA